jgi:mevalonate kinase
MARASAPGKVHLIGEHSVVYGKPAILAAIGKRCNVEVRKRKDGLIKVKREDHYNLEFTVTEAMKFLDDCTRLWNEGKEKGDWSELNALLKNIPEGQKLIVARSMEALKIKEGMDIRVDNHIPGSGLGSSAALAVTFPAAMGKEFGTELSREKINEIAFSIERYLHGGTPSGGDNTTCCYGGLVWFQKGMEPWMLEKEVPYRLEGFVLVHTGRPEKSTGELVQEVRDLEPKYREQRVNDLAKLTEVMLNVLKLKNWEKMKETINLCQRNLKELGVSTPEIDSLVSAVQKIGGAAKLCGAGGGGIVLCWHEDTKKLRKAIEDAGFEPWETELGVEGVRIEG